MGRHGKGPKQQRVQATGRHDVVHFFAEEVYDYEDSLGGARLSGLFPSGLSTAANRAGHGMRTPLDTPVSSCGQPSSVHFCEALPRTGVDTSRFDGLRVGWTPCVWAWRESLRSLRAGKAGANTLDEMLALPTERSG